MKDFLNLPEPERLAYLNKKEHAILLSKYECSSCAFSPKHGGHCSEPVEDHSVCWKAVEPVFQCPHPEYDSCKPCEYCGGYNLRGGGFNCKLKIKLENKKPLSRKEFLALPIEERRKRLAHQVDLLLDHQVMEDKEMME